LQTAVDDDDDALYDYDLNITLPHDGLFSPLFFDTFPAAEPPGISYPQSGHARTNAICSCTHELEA
jgi:hypothetical protein